MFFPFGVLCFRRYFMFPARRPCFFPGWCPKTRLKSFRDGAILFFVLLYHIIKRAKKCSKKGFCVTFWLNSLTVCLLCAVMVLDLPSLTITFPKQLVLVEKRPPWKRNSAPIYAKQLVLVSRIKKYNPDKAKFAWLTWNSVKNCQKVMVKNSPSPYSNAYISDS